MHRSTLTDKVAPTNIVRPPTHNNSAGFRPYVYRGTGKDVLEEPKRTGRPVTRKPRQ